MHCVRGECHCQLSICAFFALASEFHLIVVWKLFSTPLRPGTMPPQRTLDRIHIRWRRQLPAPPSRPSQLLQPDVWLNSWHSNWMFPTRRLHQMCPGPGPRTVLSCQLSTRWAQPHPLTWTARNISVCKKMGITKSGKNLKLFIWFICDFDILPRRPNICQSPNKSPAILMMMAESCQTNRNQQNFFPPRGIYKRSRHGTTHSIAPCQGYSKTKKISTHCTRTLGAISPFQSRNCSKSYSNSQGIM